MKSTVRFIILLGKQNIHIYFMYQYQQVHLAVALVCYNEYLQWESTQPSPSFHDR